MRVWDFILDKTSNDRRVALLYVIQSEGSSPGKVGFCMAVTQDGEMEGSIGGGVMEQKLVELAKSKLQKGWSPFIMRQIHRKDAPSDQSGMICSGEQTVAFYCLSSGNQSWIGNVVKDISEEQYGIFYLNETGIEYMHGGKMAEQYIADIKSESQWSFRELIGHKSTVYVIGGGHVGLALSETMNRLGFFVVQLDNREELNTMVNNPFAHKKEVVNYTEIENYITGGDQSYIVLVSFGYRTDKEVLKKLLPMHCKYIGMMGSEEKVRKLFDELEKEGVARKDLEKVSAPIGLIIHCKTPQEIAVSIAAQIIQRKNG